MGRKVVKNLILLEIYIFSRNQFCETARKNKKKSEFPYFFYSKSKKMTIIDSVNKSKCLVHIMTIFEMTLIFYCFVSRYFSPNK